MSYFLWICVIIQTIGLEILLLFLFITLLKRNFEEKKDKKKWNWARFLIILLCLMKICEYFAKISQLTTLIISGNFDLAFFNSVIGEMSYSTLFIGFSVVFGLIFVSYINEWDWGLYFPIFFYFEALILYLIIGFFDSIFIFILIGEIWNLFFFWEAGIKTKDTQILRLSCYYTMFFLTSLGSTEFQLLITLICIIIGLIVFQKIRVFEKENIKEGGIK